jgi:hypothetical protein
MYTFFYRSAPYPLLSTFDAPDFQTVCTHRVRSNTPLQALTIANDPAFLEIAQGLAARLLRDKPNGLEALIRHAFQLTLCREPSSEELSILKKYVHQQINDFDQGQGSHPSTPFQRSPLFRNSVSRSRRPRWPRPRALKHR